ncbi:MAG: RHS repeat-associated core domain-containing protein, partial [Bryobacteraceae bacterium]|nr:RHS repeat-associated core domain-containing protein [Bryobacteraceae bacterium]
TLLSRTDAKNQRVVDSYDSYKRLTGIARYPVSNGAADPCQSVSIISDTAFITEIGFSQTYAWGRPTKVVWGIPATSICPNGQFTETYNYTRGGLIDAKRLLTERTFDQTFQIAAGSLTALWSYDTEGRMATEYLPYDPKSIPTAPYYLYEYDAMGRPAKLRQNSLTGTELVNNVTYSPAGEVKSLSYDGYTETRTYNQRLQMTRLQVGAVPQPNVLDLEYVFDATQNDGRVKSLKNWVSGEQVDYQYDTLGRLSRAETAGAGGWGSQYGFDGFGNLVTKSATKGSPPNLSVTANPANNRLNGVSYDANGNVTAMNGQNFTYDVENRLGGHVYGLRNERISVNGSGVLVFYAPDGRRLGEYQTAVTWDGLLGRWRIGFWVGTNTYMWFGGKMIRAKGDTMMTDRLGSVRVRGAEKLDYYPWGEEKPGATVDGREKFGTYFRDSGTGLDYAVNRYYTNGHGRFLSADPSPASGGTAVPASWNRYAYVGGDPINKVDPRGLAECSVSEQPEAAVISMACTSAATGLSLSDSLWNPMGIIISQSSWTARRNDLSYAVDRGIPDRFLPGFRAALTVAIDALSSKDLSSCGQYFGKGAGFFEKPDEVLRALSTDPGTQFGYLRAVASVFTPAGDPASGSTQGFGAGEPSNRPNSGGRVFFGALISISAALWKNPFQDQAAVSNAQTLIHELGHFYNLVKAAPGSMFKIDKTESDQEFNDGLTRSCVPFRF